MNLLAYFPDLFPHCITRLGRVIMRKSIEVDCFSLFKTNRIFLHFDNKKKRRRRKKKSIERIKIWNGVQFNSRKGLISDKWLDFNEDAKGIREVQNDLN